ncbi:MAG: tripartite tricarboxylate transporter substrate binding protein [Chloroflexota bacterium]
MSLKKMSLMVVLLITAILVTACGGGEYPAGPITMMVPFRAGGGTDTQGRVLAAEMEAVLGQPVNVINNTGAGGTVGVQELIASEPDGLTMALVASTAVTVNPQLQGLTYTPEDIKVVGIASTFQVAMVTGGNAPYDTWDEWVAFAQANPGQKYMFLGQEGRQLMEVIAEIEGLEVEYVPADGGAAVAPALLAGDVDIAFSGGIHSRFLETGEMKVLMNLMSTGDLVATPGLPSSIDVYGVANNVQAILLVPADVSDEVVEQIGSAFKTAVDSDAYAETMANIQFPVTYMAYPDSQTEIQLQFDAFAASQ